MVSLYALIRNAGMHLVNSDVFGSIYKHDSSPILQNFMTTDNLTLCLSFTWSSNENASPDAIST